MYLDFYCLASAPFGANSKPEVVFPGAQYRYSLATLTHGVKEGMGMFLVTGEQGCGKSTLYRSLRGVLEDEQLSVLIIDDHDAGISEVVASIAALLDSARDGMGLNDLVDRIRGRLVELSQEGRKLVVLVDNAERLSDEVLAGLGVLSGIATPQHKLLQVVLFGGESLKTRLGCDSLKTLESRIHLHLELKRLSEAEAAAYISFRVSESGGSLDLFTNGAVSELFEASCGNPREIDRLCERALLIGYERGLRSIDSDIVREAVLLGQARENRVPGVAIPAQQPVSQMERSPIRRELAGVERAATLAPNKHVDALSNPQDEVAYYGQRRGLNARFGVVVAVVVGGVFLGVSGYLLSDLKRSGFVGGETLIRSAETKAVLPSEVRSDVKVPLEQVSAAERSGPSVPVIYQLLSDGEAVENIRPGRQGDHAKKGEVAEDDVTIPVLAATEGVMPKVRPLEIAHAPEDRSSLMHEVASAAERSYSTAGYLPFPFSGQDEGEWKKIPDKLSLSQLARRVFGSWNDSVQDILRQTNPQLKSFDAIAAGTKVWIPAISPKKLVVQLGDAGYYFYFRSTTGPVTSQKNRSYLQKKGFDASVISVDLPKGILYRIYGGPFETREQAEKAIASIKFTFAPNVLN